MCSAIVVCCRFEDDRAVPAHDDLRQQRRPSDSLARSGRRCRMGPSPHKIGTERHQKLTLSLAEVPGPCRTGPNSPSDSPERKSKVLEVRWLEAAYLSPWLRLPPEISLLIKSIGGRGEIMRSAAHSIDLTPISSMPPEARG